MVVVGVVVVVVVERQVRLAQQPLLRGALVWTAAAVVAVTLPPAKPLGHRVARTRMLRPSAVALCGTFPLLPRPRTRLTACCAEMRCLLRWRVARAWRGLR